MWTRSMLGNNDKTTARRVDVCHKRCSSAHHIFCVPTFLASIVRTGGHGRLHDIYQPIPETGPQRREIRSVAAGEIASLLTGVPRGAPSNALGISGYSQTDSALRVTAQGNGYADTVASQ